MNKQRGYYFNEFGTFMVILVAIGIAIGALLTWLLPKLWDWLKPFIHAATV